MDEKNLYAKCVVAKDQKIVDISDSDAIIDKWKGENTKIVDLSGKTLLPGFIDPHIHYTFAHVNTWIDLRPFTNSDTT